MRPSGTWRQLSPPCGFAMQPRRMRLTAFRAQNYEESQDTGRIAAEPLHRFEGKKELSTENRHGRRVPHTGVHVQGGAGRRIGRPRSTTATGTSSRLQNMNGRSGVECRDWPKVRSSQRRDARDEVAAASAARWSTRGPCGIVF